MLSNLYFGNTDKFTACIPECVYLQLKRSEPFFLNIFFFSFDALKTKLYICTGIASCIYTSGEYKATCQCITVWSCTHSLCAYRNMCFKMRLLRTLASRHPLDTGRIDRACCFFTARDTTIYNLCVVYTCIRNICALRCLKVNLRYIFHISFLLPLTIFISY